MPVYTVRNADGSDLAIDTTHYFRVHPPSRPGCVVEVETWGRRDSLDRAQAAELAKQDFDRRRKLGSCPACYFHAGRPEPGDCDRLCCSLRQVALECAGAEVSPYVRRASTAVAEAPAAGDPQGWALRLALGWCPLSLWLHERAAFVLLGAGAGAVVLLLCANWQENAAEVPRGEPSRGRGEEESP